MRQRIARRHGESLVGLEIGARDDIEVVVEHDSGGEPAYRRLEGQKLLELLAVLLEHRFGARDFEAHQHDIGTHDLRMIAQIGFRDDQRILDRRACAGREQPVEAAIERDARHDRHQNCRGRGDNREQPHNPNVQPRGGPSRPFGLDDLPDLPDDDRQQQDDGPGVDRQQRDDDIVRRRDRGQIGQNDEGGEGGQQRQADRNRPQHAQFPLRRTGKRSFGNGGLVQTHEFPGCNGTRIARRTGMSTVTDAFIQQCCRIATKAGLIATGSP